MSVFEEGKPDARETTVLRPEHSLFRKRYRQLSAEQVALHDQIKDKADELALLFEKVNDQLAKTEFVKGIIGSVSSNQGANVTIAVRHLEDAVYRAVKALTA